MSWRSGILHFFSPFSPVFDFFFSHFCPFFLSFCLLNLPPWLRKFCNCRTLSIQSPFALFSPHSAACIFTLWCATSSVSGLQCTAKWLYTRKGLGKDISYLFSKFPLLTLSCVKLAQPTAEKWTWQIHFSLQQTQHAKSWQGWATEKPKCDMKARVFIIWARVWHHFMALKKKNKKKENKMPSTKTQLPSPYLPLPESCWFIF